MSIDNENHDVEASDNNTVNQDKKDFLLNSENFEILMQAQRDIESVTEMRPTFKKLINALVNQESVNRVKNKIIEQMS